MVKGLESFKEYFKGYENQYTIIGGTACDVLMSHDGLNFRTTKDIDLVLILELMTSEFGKQLWKYIKDGRYEHCNKSTDKSQFYRFSKPKSNEYPSMIELFSRNVESIVLPDEAVLTPLPVDDDISSLLAILFDEQYYSFLRKGSVQIDGLTVLKAEYMIPFKAKAWLDLTERKVRGEHVDSKNIRKHRNDVFRLTELINSNTKVNTSIDILNNMQSFVEKMKNEKIELKQLGIIGRTKEEILEELLQIYI